MSDVLGIIGRVVSRAQGDVGGAAVLSALQRAGVEQGRWDRAPMILGPLINPANVSKILRHADHGHMSQQCDLLSEMRETWPHLASELGKRQKGALRYEYAIVPAEHTAKARARKAAKIADYVRDRLRNAVGDDQGLLSYDDARAHLLDADYFGRSGVETVFFRDRYGIGIRGFYPIQPKRLSYAGGWRPHLYDETGNSDNPLLSTFPGVDIRAAWPNKFAIHEPRVIGGEPATRQGIGRVLVWAAMFCKFTARAWMQFAELHGNPWRWASFEKLSDENDAAAVREILLQMSGLGVAVFPPGCKPEFLEAKETKTHVDLIRFWNGEISKLTVAGTLASEVGSTGGNRALGEVHERNFSLVAAGSIRAVDKTSTRDIVRALVTLQFGESDAAEYCPQVRSITELPEEVSTRHRRAMDFVDRGGKLDQDQYREQMLGLPKPAEDAVLLQPLSVVQADAVEDAAEDAAKDATEPKDSAEGEDDGSAADTEDGPAEGSDDSED